MAIIASEDQDPVTGEKRARGGGKLARSETVTVRLDPKLNYLCELAARAQRRTKSSFIEWAIEHALSSVTIPGTARDFHGNDLSINDLAADLWDTDEPDRLTALALHAPVLLSHEEQIIWKIVRTSGALWRGNWSQQGDWRFSPSDKGDLIMERVRELWDQIKAVAEGTKPRSEVLLLNPPRMSPASGKGGFSGFPDDLDDDVPF